MKWMNEFEKKKIKYVSWGTIIYNIINDYIGKVFKNFVVKKIIIHPDRSSFKKMSSWPHSVIGNTI